MSKRSAVASVVNEPVDVVVGGKNGFEQKLVKLEEPDMETFGRHLSVIAGGARELLEENAALLLRAMQGDEELKAEDVKGFLTIPTAAKQLVCDLVGEGEEFFERGMTPRQTLEVLSTYFELLGWDAIRSIFARALQNWKAAGEKATTR